MDKIFEFLEGKTIKKVTYGKDVKHNIFRVFFEDGSRLIWSPRRKGLFGVKTLMRASEKSPDALSDPMALGMKVLYDTVFS